MKSSKHIPNFFFPLNKTTCRLPSRRFSYYSITRRAWSSVSVFNQNIPPLLSGISHLPNGIRVASVNSPGACVAAGVLVEVPRNIQLPPLPGAGACLYTLEKLAFKATQNWNEDQMQARLDELVGIVQAKARKEYILYSGIVVPPQVPNLLKLLKEVMLNPRVREQEDLRGEMESVAGYEVEELHNKPEELLVELAPGPAFYSNQKTIDGFMDHNSILGVPRELLKLTAKQVLDYWKDALHPNRIIILGAGLPPGELYNAAQEVFGSMEKEASPVENNSSNSATSGEGIRYTGGFNYIDKEELPLVHMAISFAGCGANNIRRTIPLAILQMLMGGGSSFSAGGPGKGMYSRLYTQVLNRHHWVESCRMFSSFGQHTGLVGIQGSALPSHATPLAELLLDQLRDMTQVLTPLELTRAKNQVKSALLMGLESRMMELEDLGEQVAFTGGYHNPRELCEIVDEIREEEVREAAIDLLGNSAPTVIAYGPLHRMPSYETIKKWHSNRLKGRC